MLEGVQQGPVIVGTFFNIPNRTRRLSEAQYKCYLTSYRMRKPDL